MTQTSSEYEYQYQNKSLTNAHSFLTKPLLSILSEKSQPGGKILDLRCGNGSLSNLISECGYELVGMEESPSGVIIASQNFPECYVPVL